MEMKTSRHFESMSLRNQWWWMGGGGSGNEEFGNLLCEESWENCHDWKNID